MGRPKLERTPEYLEARRIARCEMSRKSRLKRLAEPESAKLERERDRERYRLNPIGKKERARKYRTEHPDVRMFTDAKLRAKEQGWEFNIEVSDIVIPEVCPVLKIPLFRVPGVEGRHKANPNSPSLDRIDNTKGYVKGNVWVISWRANHIKTDASLEELETLVASLRERLTHSHECVHGD
jgi:hypothetical protein